MNESFDQFLARVDRCRQPLPLWLLAGLFVGIFFALETAYDVSRGSDFEHWVIHEFTVVPTAWLLDWLTPAAGVTAIGNQLQAVGGGIVVKKGCEGIEVMFMLIAAFAVVPLRWRWRLSGLGVALLLAYVLNQARLIGLFYAYRADPALFDALHETVLPIVLVVLVMLFVAFWFQWAHGADRHPTAANP